MDDLMAQLNLDSLVRAGHDYELSRINPNTGRPDIFARSRPEALRDGVSVDVKIPNGLWTLTLAPQDSFAAGFPMSSAMVVVLLASIVMGLAIHALLRQPEILREKVDSATAELLALNARLEEEIGERKRIHDDLEKSRSELEQRVAERTKELQQTNRQLALEIEDRKQAEEALRESEQKYHELSITDSLTGLFNTRHFYAQLRGEIDRALRYARPLSLLLLDIDDFKVYNDTFGHMEGDDVLARLADVLRGSMRVTDSAYRYGGEEFCVILPETDGPNGLTIANRIRESFRNEVFSPDKAKEVHVTISVGIAQFETEESLESFLRRTDGNMYRAKKAGKDQVFFG
jgi:diguanylate cyclase (GGDEF)-like protein